MTEQPLTWVDRMSLLMLLLMAVAVGAAVVGVVLTVVHGDPGEAWFVAGAGAVGSTGLFVVTVLIQAIVGGDPASPATRGEGVGGRAED